MTARPAARQGEPVKTFSIDVENNIAVCASAEAVPNTGIIEVFTSEHALAELAATWPGSRLVEIWNTLPGVTPVKKFADRRKAIARIWKAIQSLGEVAQAAEQTQTEIAAGASEPEARVAPHATCVAPGEAAANDDVIPATATPAADAKLLRMLARAFEGLSPEQREQKWDALKTVVDAAKGPAVAVAKTAAPRDGSKIGQVIAMLRREGGTTLEEIMAAMEWQKHTTRALLSAGGALAKKHGLEILSEKMGDRRIYSLKV
jgi:Protein of unknown function (DUF3489)